MVKKVIQLLIVDKISTISLYRILPYHSRCFIPNTLPMPLRGLQSITWYPVPINLIVPHRISALLATVSGIALNGMDKTVFDAFHYSNMVGNAIRPLGFGIIPIKENNGAWDGDCAFIHPQISLHEPLCAIGTPGKLRHNTGINITAFVCAPTDKTSAPFNPR